MPIKGEQPEIAIGGIGGPLIKKEWPEVPSGLDFSVNCFCTAETGDLQELPVRFGAETTVRDQRVKRLVLELFQLGVGVVCKERGNRPKDAGFDFLTVEKWTNKFLPSPSLESQWEGMSKKTGLQLAGVQQVRAEYWFGRPAPEYKEPTSEMTADQDVERFSDKRLGSKWW